MQACDNALDDIMQSLNNKVDFATWLQDQLDERGWSQSELARRAGLGAEKRAMISSYLTRKRLRPDEDTLQAIAKGFGLPPEIVYRAAGIKLSKASFDETAEQILYETHDLTQAEKEEVLAFIRMKKNLREKNGHR